VKNNSKKQKNSHGLPEAALPFIVLIAPDAGPAKQRGRGKNKNKNNADTNQDALIVQG
jgi:hypothetical protein